MPLVVGNVATAAAACWLAGLGVDAIKVGVGPGRGCRTRLETGAGVPQLQAVREVLPRDRGPRARDRGRRRAGRQGPVPGDRVRSLDRHAGQPALGHRRGAGNDRGGPGDAPEDEALPRHDLARGRRRRQRGRRAGRGAAHSRGRPVRPRALRRQRRRDPGADPRPPAVGGQLRGRDDARGRPRQDRARARALPDPALGSVAAGVFRADARTPSAASRAPRHA